MYESLNSDCMASDAITLKNGPDGDVLEVSLPDALGVSIVLLNGREVAMVLRTINDDGKVSTITTGDGRHFSTDEWCEFLVEQFHSGGWRQ
jgi:hypothetical protein